MANFEVTTADDVIDAMDGVTSLREAIALANGAAGADTITFAEAIEAATITLDSALGALIITNGSDVTIDGDNDDDGNAITISGGGATRLMTVEDGATVAITSATLADGFEQGADGADGEPTFFEEQGEDGGDATGGILNAGMLTLTDVTLANNTAIAGDGGDSSVFGSAGYSGGTGGNAYGALQNLGTLTLNDVSFLNNTATAGDGGDGGNGEGSAGTGENGGDGGNGGLAAADVFNASGQTVDLTTVTLAGGSASAGSGGSGGNGSSDAFGDPGGNGGDGGNGGVAAGVVNRGTIGEGLLVMQGTSAAAGNGGAGGTAGTGDPNGTSGGAGTPGTTGIPLINISGGTSTATTEFVVDTLVDETDGDFSAGDLSLREAIALANANDDASVITFADSLLDETIELSGSQLTLTSDLTIDGDIDGDGAADITIDGELEGRVFNVTSGTATLDALTITRGGFRDSDGNQVPGFEGGGIRVSSGATLNLTNSTLSNNQAYAGGAIFAEGVLTVTNSTFLGNDAVDGAGIYNAGTVTLTNSTLSGNTASNYGGGIFNDSTMMLTNSTLSGNTADVGGGGIFNRGPATLTNSIILGNTAAEGAEIVDLISVTEIDSITTGETATVFAEVADGAGVLADNGGPVQTIALLRDASNPALDIGDAPAGVTTDANGNPRAFDNPDVDNGGTVDAGAFEVQEAPSLIVTTSADVVDSADGETSLREALMLANADAAADTITFDLAPDDTTIRLTQGRLEVTNALTIEGGGVVTITGDADGDDTVADGVTVLAETGAAELDDNVALFRLNGSEADTTFSGLTLTGGVTAGYGGAVFSQFADITLFDSVVSGNSAGVDGGGIRNSSGANTVTNSTVSGNAAGYDGGGIHNQFGANTLANSTVSGNTAGRDGGGIYNVDGANTVTNSTVSGNTAGDDGGGIRNVLGANIVTKSIVAGNVAADVGDNISGTLSLTGGNIVDDAFTIDGAVQTDGIATADIFSETEEVVVDGTGTGVFAGVLADNGGNVQTIALLASAGNVAIDAVSATGGYYDARGVGFNRTVNLLGDTENANDLGAFELQASEVFDGPLVVTTLADDGINLFDDELTLREAILVANDRDDPSTITFADDLDGQIRLGEGGQLILLSDIVIDGDNRITLSGDVAGNDTLSNGLTDLEATSDEDLTDNVTIFSVYSESEVTFRGLTFTGGAGSFGAVDGFSATSVTIADSTFVGNQASGGYVGGAAYSSGALNISDSLFEGNRGTGGGTSGAVASRSGDLTITDTVFRDNEGAGAGAIRTFGGGTLTDVTLTGNSTTGSGGAIFDEGNNETDDVTDALTLTNVTVAGNTAELQGGGILSDGRLVLENTTIHNNTSGGNGAGVQISGEGNSFTNTTFTNNITSSFGGAIAMGSGGFTADHVTLTGNEAVGDGVGSGAVYQGGSGQTVFTNSLVVGNSADADGGQFVTNNTADQIDGGNNIIGNDDAALIFDDTDTFDTEIGTVTFGVLADNGGLVRTVALLADADNAALDNASDDGPDTDARGRSRSDFAGLGLGIADIGAFELINAAPEITSINFSAIEGFTAVGTVLAIDDIDTGVTFSISGGADAGLFTVDAASGALVFADAPNFEAPADADGDNVYEVLVQAGDGNGDDFQTVLVTVTDVAEAQTIVTDPDGGPTTGSDEGDTVAGGTGDDVVDAGLGDDIIVDAGGDDTVNAGGGDDKVGLLSGMNTVSGGDGADLIVGGFGNDDLAGDAGMDVIVGDVSTNLFGSDRITGGTGNDLLEGRGGVDTFVFATNDGDDTIAALDIDFATPANSTVTGADFVSGVDVIELSGFGLADSDAALAAVTDVSGVATFDAEGTTITFAGLTADDLSADDFILV